MSKRSSSNDSSLDPFVTASTDPYVNAFINQNYGPLADTPTPGGLPRHAKDLASPFFGLQLNEGQQNLRSMIEDPSVQVVIAEAVAGSGKTLISVATARMLVSQGAFNEAVYIAPCNTVNELGYLPGDLQDKTDVYFRPLYDALIKIGELPARAIKDATAVPTSSTFSNAASAKAGTQWIEATTPTFLRGCNIEKAVVIIDECQNLTVPEIKRCVSRLHDNSKLILCGCLSQMDIPAQQSGFRRAMNFLHQYENAEGHTNENRVVTCQLNVSYRGWLAAAIDRL